MLLATVVEGGESRVALVIFRLLTFMAFNAGLTMQEEGRIMLKTIIITPEMGILKLKSKHETDISRFAVIVSCFAILISCLATRMVWPSAVFAWVSHRAESGACRAEVIAAPSAHSRVGTDPIAVPSARRCQVVGTIAVITPYYIYSVSLMAQFRTLIAEMLSKNCTKVALCAQFA